MNDINMSIGQPPQLAMVSVDAIVVDNNYQREVVPSSVRKILRKFTWRDFQPVTLADQGDGTYCVIDGQHRVHAARLHPGVNEVPAAIVQLNGDKRAEAESFVAINTHRTTVTPVDRYWAGLEAGDPDALVIKAVLDDANCDVVAAQGAAKIGQTNAVSALNRSIKTSGRGAVVRALRIMRRAWPEDPNALKGIIIQAVSRIIKHSDEIDDERLCAVLSRQSHKEISANAENLRKIAGGSGQTAIARAITETYNRGRRSKLAYFGAEDR